MDILKTNIAKCFWCNIHHEEARFEEAEIGIGDEAPRTISWLDELLKKGLHLQKDKPITLLLTGPPGGGKTTIALELCYRLAISKRLFSLYISTEADTDQIINNAISFGWKDAEKFILPFEGKKPHLNSVAVWGAERNKEWGKMLDIIKNAIDGLKLFFQPLPASSLKKKAEKILTFDPQGRIESVSPDVLVVDSLNILETGERGDAFQTFLQTARQSQRPFQLIIFILDSNVSSEEHSFWEYVCDNVIKLDYSNIHEYYVRRIEIVKARYQEHVWGRHQLKIYPKFQYPEKDREYNRKLRRAHPYREEGGIYIFPSIHYYLSVCKRKAPTQAPHYADTIPEQLNDILESPTGQKGFPEERCTAFIGSRGGHKSHLGYLHLLHRILNRKEKALVISLRDDEEMTKQTMQGILEKEFEGHDESLTELEKNNNLEILYYPPGYITPEEFIHRMLMSIQRLRKDGAKLTVLFNSLDQLSARFPMCTKQEIFVPGIIELLSAERVTSIFIAVEESGQPEEQYGLLSMADLILSFHLTDIPFDIYKNSLLAAVEKKGQGEEFLRKKTIINQLNKEECRPEIVLQVMRFAGGQRAGSCGILELIDKRDHLEKSFYDKEGLHFTPLTTSLSTGTGISLCK